MPTISVLFVDQVDSTQLLSQRGERGVSTERDALFRILRSSVAAHAGEVVDHTGDGVMAVFRGAREALDAAVEMQTGASLLDGVRLRVGINTGEPSVDGDGRWFGLPLVVAARLCAKAEPGEVLASTIVKLLTGDEALVDPAPFELKGLPLPVEAYRLDWRAGRSDSPLALPVTADLRLVGREAEVEELQRAWRTVCDGTSALVLLSGEAGAGKSRLAAEFLRKRPDALAYVGRCDEGIAAPFQPFVEALRAHVDALGRTRLGSASHELARLVPQLAVEGRPPLSSDPGTERLALFDAVTSWLADAAGVRPTILVIDDLHWAAEPTLLLLVHLLRAQPAGLLVLATYRDTDIDESTSLARAMVDLLRAPGAVQLPIGGLSPDAVRELAVNAGVDADATELAARTAGNALFVTELLLHPSESGVPTSVASLLAERLARLPEGTSTVLACAAVAGQEFSLPLVEEALSGDRGPNDVLDAAEAAERLGLLQESDAGYRFTHGLIRDALVEGLTRARRSRLHVAIAQAGHRVGLPKHELVHHLLASGDPRRVDEAADVAIAAARELFALLAFEAAVRVLSDVLDVLPDDHPSRAPLLMEAGDVLRRRRRAARALPFVEQAVDAARRHGNAEVLARAALALAGSYTGGGLDAEAGRALLPEALRGLPPDDSELRARLLAATSFLEDDLERADAAAAAATEMADRIGSPATLGYVSEGTTMAMMRHLPSPWEDFVAASERMRARCAASREPDLIVTAPLLAVHAYCPVARLDVLAEIADEMERVGTRHRYESAIAHSEVARAALGLLDGHVDEAEALWGSAMGRGVADGFTQSMILSQLFWLRRHQGRLAELAPLLTSGGLPQQTGARERHTLDAHIALARADLDLEGADEAVLDVARRSGRDGSWYQGDCIAALAAASRRSPEAATILLPKLERWTGFAAYLVHVAWFGPIDSLIGELLEVSGRPDEALARQERALDQIEHLAVPAVRAQIQLRIARARRATGDADGASDAATAAVDLARSTGQVTVAEQAEALL